jgi:hypothetical protein
MVKKKSSTELFFYSINKTTTTTHGMTKLSYPFVESASLQVPINATNKDAPIDNPSKPRIEIGRLPHVFLSTALIEVRKLNFKLPMSITAKEAHNNNTHQLPCVFRFY